VKQSSRYVKHSLYGCAAHWQHIRCSARHMGYIVAYTKMAWTNEALLLYSSTYASACALTRPPLPALCSLITIYPARQGFTGLLNEVGIHKINNTHKVTQKHFHVMSIGGRLLGNYNTICCPQCRRRANTNRNYLYWGLLLCVYCLSTRHHYT